MTPLLREAIEDVDQLGQLLLAFDLALLRAFTHTAIDMMAKYRKTDAVECSFCGRKLLKNLYAQAGLLHHPANASYLALDTIEAGDKALLFRRS